ncbi:MAG: hypothetical protein J6Y20_07350 [Lachnospiraceae bacterium]|nr:hypothetical protein [Lachnospiraceae bacterium]
MNKDGRSPFRVMCDMWGVDKAIQKAKAIGLEVSEEEIAEQRAEDARFIESISAAIKAVKETVEDEQGTVGGIHD